MILQNEICKIRISIDETFTVESTDNYPYLTSRVFILYFSLNRVEQLKQFLNKSRFVSKSTLLNKCNRILAKLRKVLERGK